MFYLLKIQLTITVIIVICQCKVRLSHVRFLWPTGRYAWYKVRVDTMRTGSAGTDENYDQFLLVDPRVWVPVRPLGAEIGLIHDDPDSKVHVAKMGPTWVLSAPDRPHVGPMNLAIWGCNTMMTFSTLLTICAGYTLFFARNSPTDSQQHRETTGGWLLSALKSFWWNKRMAGEIRRSNGVSVNWVASDWYNDLSIAREQMFKY